MAAMTGYSVDELIGQSPTIFHGPDIDPELIRSTRAALGRGWPAAFEAPCRRKDGSTVWLEVRLTPITTGEDGHPILLGIHHDITARRWTDQLLASEARVLELIAGGTATVTVFDAIAATVDGLADGRWAAFLFPVRRGLMTWRTAPHRSR